MPIYDYICPNCKREEEAITPMNENAKCSDCGVSMRRQIHSRYGINMGPVPTGGYYDETLGKHFGTNAERKREMDRQGVTERGATPKNRVTWI